MSAASAVGGGIAGAVIALLISAGFKKIKETSDKVGNTIITGTRDDGTIQTVTLKNNAILSPQFDIVKLTTSQTSKNGNTPEYTLTNDSSVVKRIFAISAIPDATMQNEGIVEISLNGVRFFPITDPVQGFMSNLDSFSVPIPDNFGLKILPKDKLKVFLWNPSGNPIELTFAVFIGEMP